MRNSLPISLEELRKEAKQADIQKPQQQDMFNEG